MNRTAKIGAGIAAGGVAVFAVATIAMGSPISAIASAVNSPSATSSAAAEKGDSGDVLATGADAEKATAAAVAAVPGGTVTKVEADDDGTFEADVTTPEGTQVEVKMDANFAVTSVEADDGDHSGGDHSDGDSSEQGGDAAGVEASPAA